MKTLTDMLKIHYGEAFIHYMKSLDMRFDIGDAVQVIGIDIPGVKGRSVVTAIDCTRNQYEITLPDNNTAWVMDMDLAPYVNTSPVWSWCRHDYAVYVGFTEQFNYCKKCGLKEGESE